jgi:exopolysaccharide biosynthesis operon protein EpsL
MKPESLWMVKKALTCHNGLMQHGGNSAIRRSILWGATCVAAMTVAAPERAYAALDYRDTLYRDTLEKAVDPPGDINVDAGNFFDVFAADQEAYDNNVYRLPTSVTDLSGIVGPNASREDHINTSTAGLDGQWDLGRQIVALDLRADDNRFASNTDLNNVSGTDKVIWNWSLASALSGQVGADYVRSLASFVNTDVYTRNVVDQWDYFGGARYQVGPRWAIFGGVIEADARLSAVTSKLNDSNQKSVEAGTEYATGGQNRVGFEYRYTDATYPNSLIPGQSNFNEDRARLFLKYAISDKTLIDASAGYLKRDYPSHAIGEFSGDTWRAALQWQPRDKAQINAVAWRELHAYLTAESDYYVSNGVSISPIWFASEKLNLSLLLSTEKQDYLGEALGIAIAGARRDRIYAEQANLTYIPVRYLTLNFSVRRAQRSSNQSQFAYNDTLAMIGVLAKFGKFN